MKNVFCVCNELQEITIPSSVTYIGENIFSNCPKLTSIRFDPNCKLESLSNQFLSNCNPIQEIELPTSITTLQENGFIGCASLSRITMPNVKHIDRGTFDSCYSLSTIELPSTLTYLGSFVFENCFELKEINIPESVVKIGDQVFLNCEALTSVTIPTSVTEVDHSLFRKCSHLKEIYIGKERIKTYPFKVTYSIMLQLKEIGIECPEVILTQEDVYLQKDLLKKNRTPIPKEVSYLDDNCFRNNRDFLTIKIHRNIKSIGKDCFVNCDAFIKNRSKIDYDK